MIYFFTHAPIAQLVEQIPLKDKVVGSIPTGRTGESRAVSEARNAGVAKLVDALGLGPSGAIYGGSSPLPGTLDKTAYSMLVFFLAPFSSNSASADTIMEKPMA